MYITITIIIYVFLPPYMNNSFITNGINIALSTAVNNKEVPVGCAIYINKKLKTTSQNKTNINKDPLSHCEYIAIHEILMECNISSIISVDIFITLEPCVMCYRVISDFYNMINGKEHEFNVYFGVYNPIFGISTILPDFITGEFGYYCMEDKRCIEILKEFYRGENDNK
ncbi:hypothetical protein NUSPORA_02648 [Nucleospora cyclopteri]